MVFKSALILSWWLAAYLLLVFWAMNWWQAALLVVALGLAVAGVGFNIQHDGGHGSYARRSLGNKVPALALDLMGGSSYMWRFKHNILHHQYTNIEGVDDDLDAGLVLRLAVAQPRMWYHRFQHVYIWPIYGFLTPKWQFWDDYHCLIAGRIGRTRIPRPRGPDLAFFLIGKLVFMSWALVIPLMRHSVGPVLFCFAAVSVITGVTLGTVFQLAHCLEEASLSPVPAAPDRMQRPWAEHQLATTVDFAPENKVLAWYLGGLNFQVEHHLFPRISHIHYPALAPIVRKVCAEHGVPYLSHGTMRQALRSHIRHLRRLGQ